MTVDFRQWRRVVKLDPARPLAAARLDAVVAWAPDAIVVGGSGGDGSAEVGALLRRLKEAGIPLGLEVSDPAVLCPGFDLYFVPMVLNSREADWIIGHHQAAVKRYAPVAEWQKLVVEGYCVLTPESTAARLAHAAAQLDAADVEAYALLAEHLLKLPIFYLEYSGSYGPPQLVRGVRAVLQDTRLWYGGGIRSARQLREMEALADTIVVGNAVYEEQFPAAFID